MKTYKNKKTVLTAIITSLLLTSAVFAKERLDTATDAQISINSSEAMRNYSAWSENQSADDGDWITMHNERTPSYKKFYYPKGTRWVRAVFRSGGGEYIERIFPPYSHSPASGRQTVYAVINDCNKPHEKAPAIKSNPQIAYCKAISTENYLQGRQCRGVPLKGGQQTHWVKNKNGACQGLVNGFYGNPKIGVVKLEVML